MANLIPANTPVLLTETQEFLKKKMKTPDIEVLRKSLDACRATGHTDCVQGMYLVGESGTGKSYIARSYVKKSPPYEDGLQTIIPILYVNLPEKATGKVLVTRLFRKLTGLKKVRGSEEEIQARLISRLIAARTEMVIVDESQHLVRETSSVSAQHAADAIKAIMDTEDGAGIPVVCMGIDSALGLLNGKAKFKAEKQLKRRNRQMHRIAAYPLGSQNWNDLMSWYQGTLQCEVNLCSEDMLKRLHLATDGLFGSLTPLFKEAIELAGAKHAITQEHLEQAYQLFQPVDDIGCNPFKATITTVELNLTARLIQKSQEAA
ncbi:MAG: type II secretory pathway predicted ATPase ExeA [Cocleimonas sp.]|jgi:type II secretory pathway predicted ATPase ExeA